MTAQAPGSGSAARFAAQVMLAHGSDLYRFLTRRLRRQEDAADVAQEVYLRLLRLPRTDLIRKPHAYVYFIASQIAAEYRMRERNAPLAFDSEALDRLNHEAAYARPDAAAEDVDTERELRRLLGRLPVGHRNVLILSRRDGYSNAEIAARLGLSEHTVKKYLYEATARIAFHRRRG